MIDNTLLLNGLKQGIYIENSEYFNTRGEKVPRVTDVLSATIYSDALIYWANSLGFRRIKYKIEHYRIDAVYLMEKLLNIDPDINIDYIFEEGEL